MQSHSALGHSIMPTVLQTQHILLSRCPASITLLSHIIVPKNTGLDWECFQIKIISDAILSIYPALIHVKSLKTWIHGHDSSPMVSALKQHTGSLPASWLLFMNLSSDLHVESISLWASMKLHSNIYFSKRA